MLPFFSSMNVSAMKLLTMEGLTGAYVLDQTTTPDVVRTSKASNMLNLPAATDLRDSRTACDLDGSRERRREREAEDQIRENAWSYR